MIEFDIANGKKRQKKRQTQDLPQQTDAGRERRDGPGTYRAITDGN